MEVCKVLLLIISAKFLGYSANISTRDDDASWRKITLESAGFQCFLPQPRSISFKDFIEDSKLLDVNTNVIPMMTVLHRCDSQSGCCTRKDEVCSPIEEEQVTLTFQMVTVMPDYKTKRNYETVVAVNHTRCACELSILSKV